MKRGNLKPSMIRDYVERFIYFGRNSSIQGLKYVFQERGAFISRLLWSLLLVVFTGCLYLLLVPVVQRRGSISLSLDTSYLNWSTKFPAVTVCEIYNSKAVQMKIVQDYPDLFGGLNYDGRRHIADLVYGRGSCSSEVCSECGTMVDCDVPWRNIIENVHKKCGELIENCYFNNIEFSCCDRFYTVDSEYGPCLSFNSLQHPDSNTNNVQFYSNRSSGPGVLSFRLLSDAQISVHSSEELSTNVLDKKLRFDTNTYVDRVVDYFFSVVEVDNEPEIENENVGVRQCLYGHEIPDLPLHTYQTYSYGGCRLAVRTQNSFNVCHCVHPVRDIRYKELYCNYSGMNCLVTYEGKNAKLGVQDDYTKDAVNCLPSCGESELQMIHLSKRQQPQDHNNGSLVNVRMSSLPVIRYQKSLLRTKLDFVVTMGGMVGLFFGASILSFVEIFYLVLRAPNKK